MTVAHFIARTFIYRHNPFARTIIYRANLFARTFTYWENPFARTIIYWGILLHGLCYISSISIARIFIYWKKSVIPRCSNMKISKICQNKKKIEFSQKFTFFGLFMTWLANNSGSETKLHKTKIRIFFFIFRSLKLHFFSSSTLWKIILRYL